MSTSARFAQETRARLVQQLKAVATEYGCVSPQIMTQARRRRLCAEPREFILSFGSLLAAARVADIRYSPAASPQKRIRSEDEDEPLSVSLVDQAQVEELLRSTFTETGISATSLKKKLGITFDDLASFFPHCCDLQQLARSLDMYYSGKRRTKRAPE